MVGGKRVAVSGTTTWTKKTVHVGIFLGLSWQFVIVRNLSVLRVHPKARDCSNYDFVFFAGTGRSGSTTLMTFLNNIDGVHILGENNSTVKHLPMADV
jgi:hypothetical protein